MTFAKNISTDTKLSKCQLSKIIQLGGILADITRNLGDLGKAMS